MQPDQFLGQCGCRHSKFFLEQVLKSRNLAQPCATLRLRLP
jgi:hypothetical protein